MEDHGLKIFVSNQVISNPFLWIGFKELKVILRPINGSYRKIDFDSTYQHSNNVVQTMKEGIQKVFP